MKMELVKNTYRVKILSVVAVLIFSFFSNAKVFEEQKGNTDVIFIKDHYLEFSVKLFMINSAKKSIDISSFFIGNDYFGKNILFSLRNALERGVKVKILHEGMNMRLGGEKDLLFKSQSILLDNKLRQKAEIISLNPIQKKLAGLNMDDCIHQKLLIIDAGLDDEKVYFGGRDLANNFSHMLDSGYLLRPIDKNKKYVGSDIVEAFNTNWTAAEKKFKKDSYSQSTVESTIEKLLSSTPKFQIMPEQFPAYIQITKVLRGHPTEKDKLLPFQFRPVSGQLVTNDFLIKMLEPKHSNIRSTLLQSDDVMNFMYFKIYNARDVQTASYSADFGNQILRAFENVIKNSGKIKIYTDGEDAMRWLDTVTTGEFLEMGVLSFLHSIDTMTALNRLTISRDQLQFYALNRSKVENSSSGKIKFLHRKLFLVDNDIVLTGSHNFTRSSAEKNDELLVSFKDERLNSYLKSMNESEEGYYDLIKLESFPQIKFEKMKFKEKLLGNTVRDLY